MSSALALVRSQWQLGAAFCAGAGVSSSVLGAIIKRYLQNELRPPKVIHGTHSVATSDDRDDDEEREAETPEQRRLLLEVLLVLRDYWPHPILEFSGYISTMWCSFWALTHGTPTGMIESLVMADGGTVSLHWAEKSKKGVRQHRGIVLILPGLNNDSGTFFVQSIMEHLADDGFRPVALNYRGVGGLELTSHRMGCCDSWRDVDDVAAHIERKYPEDPVFGVGYSMGGGILLKYLGEYGSKSRLRVGVTLAAPLDYLAVANSLTSSFRKRLVSRAMVTGLKALFFTKFFASEYSKGVDANAIRRAHTLRQIDEAIIVPLHGYKDADDYYTQNNPRSCLQQIAVPTLIVHAEDDPVISAHTLPLDEVRKNRKLYMAITRRGGHIGWGSGGLGAKAWTDKMAAHFLQLHWSSTQSTSETAMAAGVAVPVAQSRL